MSKNEAFNNVIQFPGRKKEGEPSAEAKTVATAVSTAKQPSRAKASKKTIAGSVIAILLATGAVNRFAFSPSQSSDFASQSGRSIASVEQVKYERDAKWEKQLAESLASDKVRNIASTQIGRSATAEEKLRWGTLEEKYTITYRPEASQIRSILLQDPSASPSYVLDRMQFLKEYGSLLESGYGSAKLKSVETSEDKTIESYTIFDKENHAKSEARFELDRHKRLLSLKVEPQTI
jgi:hypothetical protein